jgi:hypothetical protein
MPAQETLNKNGVKYIAGLRNTAKAIWKRACEHDKIPPESKFVVFSVGNPSVPFYNICMSELFHARQEFADGGYVGLQIGRGRVHTA